MINTSKWDGLNVCLVDRDGHRYVFLFDEDNLFSLECQIERFLLNPELNFTAADGIAVMKNARMVVDMED